MASYYGQSYIVKNSIVLTDENNGGYYKFTSPFNETVYGFLKRITQSVTSIAKADCEFVCNYTPTAVGEGFNRFVLLTGSGTWETPADVLQADEPRIRIVLIGGGQGGESGYAGEKGQNVPKDTADSTRKYGGNPGNNGASGKVYQITIDNPAASYTYSAGSGGAGGAVCTSHSTNNAGSLGTDSTVTDGVNTYSSNSGEVLATGYLNFITNDVYASFYQLPNWGEDIGAPVLTTDIIYGGGAYGGSTASFIRDGNTVIQIGAGGTSIYKNELGQPVNSGGSGSFASKTYIGSGSYAWAGCPGGGAMNQNGGAATNPTYSNSTYKAGNGGKGADASWIPPSPLEVNAKYFGYGGHGGAGGGAGGASGYVKSSVTSSIGTGGAAGKGGVGGVGGDGCVLIYY